ncbi:MAG: ferrochelatase [Parasphingorhabdus sp.]|nr:ferrochelatase [Parasphingorhabdus sp.]
MNPPPDHPEIKPPRIGVLLVNLGTPAAPTEAAVKTYLQQFLSDRRVVELPALIWQPILRGFILNTRPAKSAEAYQKVWSDAGSPLAAYTAAQAKALQARLGDAVQVEWAMRYGEPAIRDRLEAMKAAGATRILVAPMYPQYCAATTASVHDDMFDSIRAMRWQPALRTMPPYHDDQAYIGALADSLEAGLAALDFVPDAILTSFHGMPERTLLQGDPYHCQCQKTARLLSERTGRELTVTFQSRFGRAKWLEPATDTVLEALPAKGVRKVAIIAPGFSADCLETLEELAIRGQEQFEEAGGERFAYIPCLNASDGGNDLIEHLIRRELSGWL